MACMRCLILILVLCCPALQAIDTPVIWDLSRLESPPPHRWRSQEGPVHALFYEGEPYQGKPTEVFAFYASPATVAGKAAPAGGFPGVVLIHGGGGTAFADWALLWAQRGYAAIAMDLAGHETQAPVWIEEGGEKRPAHAAKPETRTRLPNGGPNQGPEEKFDSIRSDDPHDHWPYHAVASAIRAHSLLRRFPEVNPERTAVTGISWGGYTTCLVASVDPRFKAAAPVYGCGFLFEGESVQKAAIDRLGDLREKWIAWYDPSRHLPKGRVPMLFVNGTNDQHYPLDSYQRSFDRVPHANKQLRVEVNMRHSHPAGWAPAEIGRFIDSFCLDGPALPRTGPLTVSEGRVRLPYEAARRVVRAQLHYTTDTGPRVKRNWQSLDAEVTPTEITCPSPPTQANTWFLSLTDEMGHQVSSEIRFAPELGSQAGH